MSMNSRHLTFLLVLLGLLSLYIPHGLAHPAKARAYRYQGVNTIRNITLSFDLTNVASSGAGRQQFAAPVSGK
jgi:hypothetical protein